MPQDFKFDFSNLSNSPWVGDLGRHIAAYEKRAKQLVREIDLRSRGAREKSLKRLEQLSNQLNKARGQFERRATDLLQKESKRLNGRVNELMGYIRSIAKAEKPAKKSAKRSSKSTGARSRTLKRPTKRSSTATTASVSAEASPSA